MPDLWELAMDLDPFTDDADEDDDGDGLSNRQEYLAGTNPLDPTSYLRIDGAGSPGGIRLRVSAVAGRSYTIQYRDTLDAGQWSALTNIAAQAADHATEILDPLPIGVAKKFYRLSTP